MSKITQLKKQQTRDRVSVFVDDKYSFSVTLDQLLELKLKNGLEVSRQDIIKYKNTSDYGKLLEKSIAWALTRPHSQRELQDYLYSRTAKGEEGAEDRSKIIDYLTERGYVDDVKFAKFWAESRIRSKSPSRRKLNAELQSKGIGSEIIKKTLDDLMFDENQMLEQVVDKKRKQEKFQDDAKLMTYLAGQGFGYSDIKEVLGAE